MHKVEIGRVNKLAIIKEVEFGLYLDGKEFGEILLPGRYIPEQFSMNDILEVFVYLDSEDRLVATTEKPYASVGEFAYLLVVSVTAVGAFLDWGLPKDLFVPFREQQQKMKEGRSYTVYVYLDRKTNRIAATSKLDKHLDSTPRPYRTGQKVDLLICNETEMGYNAIINNAHRGLIFKNDIFQTLRSGQRIKGYIKRLREDGKTDLSLQKPGHEKIGDIAEKIMIYLDRQGGFMAFTDKTPPNLIYQTFGVSKKVFKQALGALYKHRRIIIDAQGVRLAKPHPEIQG